MSSSLNLLAGKIRDELDDIASDLDGGLADRARRSELNKRAHRLKALLQWVKAGAASSLQNKLAETGFAHSARVAW